MLSKVEIDKLALEAEQKRIKEVQSLSYAERFERLLVLIKLSYEFRNAKIIRKK